MRISLGGGYGGLAEAYAAVVRWDAMVRQYLEARVGEAGYRAFQQEHVLENAAGESDCAEAGLLADSGRGVHCQRGDAVVEASRDRWDGDVRAEVGHRCVQQVAAGDGEDGFCGDGCRVCGPVGRVGALFEFDCCLALVVDPAADAEDGGFRVEQAAHA